MRRHNDNFLQLKATMSTTARNFQKSQCKRFSFQKKNCNWCQGGIFFNCVLRPGGIFLNQNETLPQIQNKTLIKKNEKLWQKISLEVFSPSQQVLLVNSLLERKSVHLQDSQPGLRRFLTSWFCTILLNKPIILH